MDVVTYALSKKYTNKAIEGLIATGVKYKGSKNSFAELPAPSADNKGDMYTISGIDQPDYGCEYLSDGTQWIALGPDVASIKSDVAGLKDGSITAGKALLANDAMNYAEGGSISAAINSKANKAYVDDELAKKANLPDELPPELKVPGVDYPWFMINMDPKSIDADGNLHLDHSGYNFNTKQYYTWKDKVVPMAATTATGGLMTAADKVKVNAALTEHQDISGKLNVLPKVDDPTDPGYGWEYHIPYRFDVSLDAEKANVDLHTLTLDNKLTKMVFNKQIPAATTTAAGLMSAADKAALNGKQDKLTAGANITISSDNVISATGGSSPQYIELSFYSDGDTGVLTDEQAQILLASELNYIWLNGMHRLDFRYRDDNNNKATYSAVDTSSDGNKTHSVEINLTTKAFTVYHKTLQELISDLATIRSGAALGATAIQQHQDISGKLNVLPKVDDPTDPGYGWEYHIPYRFDVALDAEKADINLHTLTLDNKLTKMVFNKQIPSASTTMAGLMSAADKVALNGKQDKFDFDEKTIVKGSDNKYETAIGGWKETTPEQTQELFVNTKGNGLPTFVGPGTSEYEVGWDYNTTITSLVGSATEAIIKIKFTVLGTIFDNRVALYKQPSIPAWWESNEIIIDEKYYKIKVYDQYVGENNGGICVVATDESADLSSSTMKSCALVIGSAVDVYHPIDNRFLKLDNESIVLDANGALKALGGASYTAGSRIDINDNVINVKDDLAIENLTVNKEIHSNVQDGNTLFNVGPVYNGGSILGDKKNAIYGKGLICLNLKSGKSLSSVGENSVILGTNCFATNQSAFACGTDTQAVASYSFASGRNTYASKKCTFAGGEGTKADREYEFVVGRYNRCETDKQLFVVGNGTSDAVRNNAFTVYEDGNVEAGGTVNGIPAMPTADGDYKLHVENGVATWVAI